MISIIIPTYNEENYLPKLLNSIKKQNFSNYEIIVSDNNSTDKTVKIAKKYNCIVVKGGSPAKARNNGAKIAKGDLLFLDSDIILPKDFLKTFFKKIKNKKLDLGSCKVIGITKKLSYRFFYFCKNFYNKHFFIRRTSGQCLFIKKKLFNKINGYDETLILAEEHDLVQRAKGKYYFFTDIYVYNYPRRLVKEGFFKIAIKSHYSEFYRIFIGKIRKKIFNYEFGNYNNN